MRFGTWCGLRRSVSDHCPCLFDGEARRMIRVDRSAMGLVDHQYLRSVNSNSVFESNQHAKNHYRT